jgi:hypothetical protein
VIPAFIDEELDYIEANQYIAHEWKKRCIGIECVDCNGLGKCLRAWDWVADQTLDKRLKKSDYINLIERKHGYVLRKEG